MGKLIPQVKSIAQRYSQHAINSVEAEIQCCDAVLEELEHGDVDEALRILQIQEECVEIRSFATNRVHEIAHKENS